MFLDHNLVFVDQMLVRNSCQMQPLHPVGSTANMANIEDIANIAVQMQRVECRAIAHPLRGGSHSRQAF